MKHTRLLNDKIPFRVFMPNDSFEKPVPVAILCCGNASGSMMCVGDYYRRMTSELNQKGIATICFDFAGNGIRAQEVAHDDEADLEQIYDYIKSNDELDANRLLVHGYSMSTVCCTEFVSKHPDAVVGYSMQAPVLTWNDEFETMSSGQSVPNFNFMEDGEVKIFYNIDEYYGNKLRRDIISSDGIAPVLKQMRDNYHGNLTIYVGKEDEMCMSQVDTLESYCGVKCNIMPGGHTMGLYDELKVAVDPNVVMSEYCSGIANFAEQSLSNSGSHKSLLIRDKSEDNVREDAGSMLVLDAGVQKGLGE